MQVATTARQRRLAAAYLEVLAGVFTIIKVAVLSEYSGGTMGSRTTARPTASTASLLTKAITVRVMPTFG